MLEIFLDALIDSAKMLPLLLLIYIIIEILEVKFAKKMRQKVQKAGVAGPAIGALVGSIPQCGFSVITSALYTKRLITIGTLMAVYLSTSDEAIPVILSQPDKAVVVLPLILTKIIIALVASYIIDFLFRKSNQKILSHAKLAAEGKCQEHDHKKEIEERACCGHEYPPRKLDWKKILIHPLVHTIKIFIFIFIVTFLINFILFKIGEESFKNIFLSHSFFQPFIAALIGLIPNCAASVAITELYLKGAIGFGSTIAGLSSAGGLGLLVLFKENKDYKNTLQIVGLLVGISAFVGILIQYFYS